MARSGKWESKHSNLVLDITTIDTAQRCNYYSFGVPMATIQEGTHLVTGATGRTGTQMVRKLV